MLLNLYSEMQSLVHMTRVKNVQGEQQIKTRFILKTKTII